MAVFGSRSMTTGNKLGAVSRGAQEGRRSGRLKKIIVAVLARVPVLSHHLVGPIHVDDVRITRPVRNNSGDHRVVDAAGWDPAVDWAA